MSSVALHVLASPAVGGDARGRRTIALADAVVVSLAVVAAAGLKRHYTNANAEDLGWLLCPATSLVESVTGQTFVREARVGFVAERLPMVIAPACAGLNYLVIAFLTLVIGFVREFPRVRDKAAWFVGSIAIAYFATLIANTCRIGAAVGLHENGFRAPWCSPAEFHRALGVGVYLASIWLLFAVAEAAFRRIRS
jgi:exosortase K